jgi:hypothetical protein
MPLTLNTLCPIGGHSRRGAAPQMWSYTTQDAAADVDTAGYFNGARHLLAAGDLVYRVTVNGSGVVQTAGFHVVNDVAGTNVDVADTLPLTVTDTD